MERHSTATTSQQTRVSSSRRRSRLHRSSWPTLAGLTSLIAAASWSGPADAKGGTHAPAVSSWDTRASSVIVGGRTSFVSGGGRFFNGSYNANFTSTAGTLSAQFGLHYLQFRQRESDPVAHGMAGSAVALFSFPLAGRFEDGVPKSALGFYLGSVPTALVSGRLNFITLPLNIGLGVPLSPGPAITFTPWVEIAPSINLDSEIHDVNLESIGSSQGVDLSMVDPNDPDSQAQVAGQLQDLTLTQAEVAEILAQGVDIVVEGAVAMRAGLQTNIHLSESWDLNAYATFGSFASTFSGTTFVQVGGALGFRWDSIVPAVLPAERRLERETCEDVEARFKMCPQYQQPQLSPAEAPAEEPPPPLPPAPTMEPTPRPDTDLPTNPAPPESEPPPPAPADPPPAPETAPGAPPQPSQAPPAEPPPGASGSQGSSGSSAPSVRFKSLSDLETDPPGE